MVVVGGGFAGIECAKELAGEELDVLLLDQHNFHTFLPLLYQVATAGLAPADVAYPLRAIFQRADNVRVRKGTVTGVEWGPRRLHLDDRSQVPFDYLVLATGATTNWLGIPGAQQHGLALYTLLDAIRLRNHVLDQFERAARAGGPGDPASMTVVVVGGGPTGVETAGALTELFAMVLAKDFPDLDMGRARVVLVEAADRLLAPFSARAQRHAAHKLRGAGVEVRLRDAVESVGPDSITLRSGAVVPARTLVWAAGVRASSLADALGLEQTTGRRIVVGPDLQVPGRPGTFAVGDLAAIPGRDGRLLPQLAPVAKQSGRFAARQVCRLVAGGDLRSFRYRDRGTMATIGRHAAVADLPFGIHLTATPAWLAWLLLHITFLIGFRNRLSVFVNWAWNYVTYDRGPRLILAEAPEQPGPPAG